MAGMGGSANLKRVVPPPKHIQPVGGYGVSASNPYPDHFKFKLPQPGAGGAPTQPTSKAAPTPSGVPAPAPIPAPSTPAPVSGVGGLQQADEAFGGDVQADTSSLESLRRMSGGGGSNEVAAHMLSGPSGGRGGIGQRIPPSLAALLRYRAY